ncbi:MAG: hypothetical protein QXY15_07170 [Candidatus Nitrosotenuis sp.]
MSIFHHKSVEPVECPHKPPHPNKHPTTFDRNKIQRRLDRTSNASQNDFNNILLNPPDDFKESLDNLSTLTIKDMRPNRSGTVNITDKSELLDVMKFIYQVRNNLFHGGKDVDEERDKKIIKYSAVVLFRILQKVLTEEKLI